MRVTWLGEADSLDEARVGGKTANLGRLAASFRVPAGFCLDAGVHERLGGALEGEASARDALHELVVAAYTDLARRLGTPSPRVAVRSSAIGEDSRDSSFAGQYETILDVGGAHDIVEAVLRCWRSLTTDRAIAYRRERGIEKPPRIAVLVQQMVEPEISAIAFSADPVTGARDRIVINAARGLGDAIASGEVTPDSFAVRKDDLAILERRGANGYAIEDGAVVAIARLTKQLEETMGHAVDVECALAQGELHLLQCRPVTTLQDEFPVSWPDPEDAKLSWGLESVHMPQAMPPLATDYVTSALYAGMRRFGEEARAPFRVRALAFNGRIYDTAVPVVAKEDLPAELTASVQRRRAVGRHVREDWDQRHLPELRAHYEWMRSRIVPAMTRGEAAAACEELWERLTRIWTIHFWTVMPAYAVMEELAQEYEKLVGGRGADAFALTQGLAPTLQQLERDLCDLTEAARQTPEVAKAIAEGERSPAALRRRDGSSFAARLDDFLARHGDVGQHGFGLHEPAYADEPSLLIAAIAQRLTTASEAPDARITRVRDRAAELADRVRRQLADRAADRERFDALLDVARAAGPLSEEHNYWIDRVAQAHARRLVREFGERLVRERAIRRADEVFFLHHRELVDALRDPRDLTALVDRRAAELARWQRLRAPATLGAPAEPPMVAPGIDLARVSLAHTVAQDDRFLLKGVTACAGLARGRARLMREGDDFARLGQGEVLVCRSTNASWVPLFTVASAVVTEIGGSLSHAAVVAREFGVPCVVAVQGALDILSDGEPVEVDAAAATVRRLFPVEWSDPDDAKLLWVRDDAHTSQVLPPLAIESTRHGPTYGMRRRDEDLGPPVVTRIEGFNGRTYISTKHLRPEQEMAAQQREALARRRRLARRIRRDWDERYLPELDTIYEWMRSLSLERLSGPDAATAWDELWRRHRRAWRIHMTVTAGAYPVMDELAELYAELVGGSRADAVAMTQGLAHTLQQLERDLHELSETARRSQSVADAIARGAPPTELAGLDAAFAAAMDAFLRVHGDAGASGDHFGSIAWRDDPALLVRAIAQRLAAPPDDPTSRHRRLRQRADELVAAARAALAGRPADLERFDEVLAAACAAGPLTEEHNYWLDRRHQAHLGRAARAFGARLVRDGALRDAEDIFLLYIPEVRDALRAPRDLAALIAERKAELERWRSFEAPETIGGAHDAARPMAFLLYRAEQGDTSRELHGAPASAGVARGPARLIRNLEEFARLRRGDVLVCQSSNVSWIPLFVNAAAVITEVGGPLSHAAVVAREFGIPAVVGTSAALSALTDGEPLEVDGSAGVVRRLSAP